MMPPIKSFKPNKSHKYFTWLACLAWLTCLAPAHGAGLTLTASLTLSGTELGGLAWGDYDKDGKPDLVVTGKTGGAGSTVLYHNTGVTLADASASLAQVYNSAVAWGDYDNDGALDLALSGTTDGSTRVMKIYRNLSGAFSETFSLEGVEQGSLAWLDVDGDGKSDLLVTGTTTGAAGGCVTRIYKNSGSAFTEITQSTALKGVRNGALAVADVDLDGDMDFFITGSGTGGSSDKVATLYLNGGTGVFTASGVSLAAVEFGALAVGDLDADGDPDLVLNGVDTNSLRILKLYKNTLAESGFGLTEAGTLAGVSGGGLAVGDLDHDGKLDLAITGTDAGGRMARVHVNAGSFAFSSAVTLTGTSESAVALADWDSDGDLDVAVTGRDDTDLQTWIYVGTGTSANAAPTPPTSGFGGALVGGVITLSWGAGSDDVSGPLAYHARIGTTSGGDNLLSSQLGSPFRGPLYPARIGLAAPGLILRSYPVDTVIYWSVQAIDVGLKTSAWSDQQAFYTGGLLSLGANGRATHQVKGGDISVSSGKIVNPSGSAVSGIPLQFTVTKPDASTYVATASTGSDGVATLTVPSSEVLTPGMYRLAIVGLNITTPSQSLVFAVAPSATPGKVTVFPNPFTPTKSPYHTAGFVVEGRGSGSATLKIFDIGGTLRSEKTFSSSENIEWDGLDAGGRVAEGGGYIWRLAVDGKIFSGTLILLR